jgi:hypothetical protein
MRDYVVTVTLAAAAIVGMAVLVTAVTLVRIGGRLPRRRGGSLMLSLLLALIVITVVAFVLKPADLFEQRVPEQQEEPDPASPVGGRGSEPRDPVQFKWDAAAVTAALLLLGGAAAYVVLVRRASERSEGDLPLADAVADILADTLDDLRSEADARRAVIAAYARLERVLAARGVPRQPSEAPLEYLSRILLELDVSPAAVLALTELFERAKFSPHEIDAAMKDEAIEALASVRQELREAA